VKINKHILLIALIASITMITSCSKEADNEKETKATPDLSPNPAVTPMNMQPSSTTALPPTHPKFPAQAAAPQQPSAGQGKVLSVTSAAGYTYMEVDLGNKKTWLAATSIEIKEGDTVQWKAASVMNNFKSNTLQRTFKEILFVSQASAVK